MKRSSKPAGRKAAATACTTARDRASELQLPPNEDAAQANTVGNASNSVPEAVDLRPHASATMHPPAITPEVACARPATDSCDTLQMSQEHPTALFIHSDMFGMDMISGTRASTRLRQKRRESQEQSADDTSFPKKRKFMSMNAAADTPGSSNSSAAHSPASHRTYIDAFSSASPTSKSYQAGVNGWQSLASPVSVPLPFTTNMSSNASASSWHLTASRTIPIDADVIDPYAIAAQAAVQPSRCASLSPGSDRASSSLTNAGFKQPKNNTKPPQPASGAGTAAGRLGQQLPPPPLPPPGYWQDAPSQSYAPACNQFPAINGSSPTLSVVRPSTFLPTAPPMPWQSAQGQQQPRRPFPKPPSQPYPSTAAGARMPLGQAQQVFQHPAPSSMQHQSGTGAAVTWSGTGAVVTTASQPGLPPALVQYAQPAVLGQALGAPPSEPRPGMWLSSSSILPGAHVGSSAASHSAAAPQWPPQAGTASPSTFASKSAQPSLAHQLGMATAAVAQPHLLGGYSFGSLVGLSGSQPPCGPSQAVFLMPGDQVLAPPPSAPFPTANFAHHASTTAPAAAAAPFPSSTAQAASLAAASEMYASSIENPFLPQLHAGLLASAERATSLQLAAA